MKDELPAKFMIAKISKDFLSFRSLQNRIDGNKLSIDEIQKPEHSLLDEKIEEAKELLKSCCFCERRCGIDRTKGEIGSCGCGPVPEISSSFVHLGEEPELVPSYTIFFMGCTFHCRFCQNYSISQWLEAGSPTSVRELAQLVESGKKQGCRNVNFVGGDPTPWTFVILEAMKYCRINIPVVWNSNSGYSERTAFLLKDFVDVYLLDFKYGPDDCSERLSDFSDYWKTATRNHLYAKDFGELIIRHLVLPNHLECCTLSIFEWVVKHLGPETRVNIMFQYRPEYKAFERKEISRSLTKDEMKRAIKIAKDVGLCNYIT
jgi:putative pyruvate formate lyase activating enzyme